MTEDAVVFVVDDDASVRRSTERLVRPHCRFNARGAPLETGCLETTPAGSRRPE
jgi:hypothetical protein